MSIFTLIRTRAHSMIADNRSFFTRMLPRNPRTRKWVLIGAALLIVLAIIFIGRMLGGNETEDAPQSARQVEVASVSELSGSFSPLSVVGTVKSAAQAELRTEVGGQVRRVYYQAGARVPAGAIIAEMKNDAERAAVTQAQGSLTSAEAAYERALAGARPEDRAVTASTLATERENAVSDFRTAFTAAQDAVQSKADDFFRNPRTYRPNFIPTSASYEEARALEEERVALGAILESWEKEAAQITANDGDLASKLDEGARRLARVKSFLDNIAIYVSRQTPTSDLSQETIDAQEAVLLTARSNVDTARTSIVAAGQALTTAVQESVRVESGERPEDVKSAEGSLLSARGSFAAAVARLENTRIRTPIAGTLEVLAIDQGDFVPAQTLAAVVTNKNAGLQIEAFISSAERAEINEGATARIEGRYEGIVTNIAPGVDPTTGKIRVLIGVSEEAVSLVENSTVTLAINRLTGEEEAGAPIYLPLAAVKINTDSAVVFGVDAHDAVVAYPVTLGSVVGDDIEIVSGITADTRIITDARGLRAGDTVRVASSQ